MNDRLAIVVLALVGACCGPSRPLSEAILGEWEVLCRTDKESTATCLGKEDDGLYKHFLPGGRLVSGARRGTSMTGTWTLTGDGLVLSFEGGGMHLQEGYRARIEDDKLVLWYRSQGFGSVLGRVGAAFEPAPSVHSSGERTSHAIGDVAYALALPAGYRLVRDDNNRQQWAPTSGLGFTVLLTLSPRAQTLVDGEFVTPPCNDYDYGGVSGSSSTIDGVERSTSIGTSLCLEGSEQVLMCSAEHTRGYLEDPEKDGALALCKSLVVTRQGPSAR